jgi:hypothetical protein
MIDWHIAGSTHGSLVFASMASSELVYATCSLLYADGGADLWFIGHETMAGCEGKLFRMLCKMGRDDDVKRHLPAMPLAVVAQGLVSASRHGRLHVVITLLNYLTTKDSDGKVLLETLCNTPFKFKHRGTARMPDVALERAIRFGHLDIVQQLVGALTQAPSQSTDAHSRTEFLLPESAPDTTCRPLSLASPTLHQALVEAIKFKRRDILQFLLTQQANPSKATEPGFNTLYRMWRMVVTVGATELASLLPTTGVQAIYEQAARDDNWALILLLHQECKENVRITEAMLPHLTQSRGTLRHIAWLLDQPLPNITLCLRHVLRRAIKSRDWAATETLLKHERTPIFLDDMLWLCQGLLDIQEADKHMLLFRMALQRVANPLRLIIHALPKDKSKGNAGNGAALTAIVYCVRRSHIFSDLDTTRRAVLALARHAGSNHENDNTSLPPPPGLGTNQGDGFAQRHVMLCRTLLDLIGEDHDLLHPVLTQLWEILATSQAWSILEHTLTWGLSKHQIPQDQHLAAALAATNQANQTDLAKRLRAISKSER